MGALNRRNLFGYAPAAAVMALAVPVMAQPSEPWDTLIASLAVIHPDLAELARNARSSGYHPDELSLVFIPPAGSNSEPYLLFRREYGPTPGPRTFPTHHVSRTEGI